MTTSFFPIACICLCLTMLSVTQDYVYLTSSQRIAEQKQHVEVVEFKLLPQHLPGETRRNNEKTSASQSVWSAMFRSGTSLTGDLQPNLLVMSPLPLDILTERKQRWRRETFIPTGV